MPIRRCLVALLWALCSLGAAQAGGVLIVSSDPSSASYAEAANALSSALQLSGVRDIAQRDAKELAAMDWSGAALPKVVVALGAEGLRQVVARDMRVPVIATLIPRQSFEGAVKLSGNKANAAVALYLDQPVARQLELLRLAFPSARRVGVVWGPDSAGQQPAWQAAMRARTMQEVPASLSASTTLFDALQTALDDVQVLLAVPDPQVYNPATIANILLTTYRARVPVMGFSPAMVHAGALVSVHTSPRQIGAQAAQMVRLSLQGGAAPVSQYPVEFEVSVNERVARTLGLKLDAADLSERLHKLEGKP